jgi:hypothetical protein
MESQDQVQQADSKDGQGDVNDCGEGTTTEANLESSIVIVS